MLPLHHHPVVDTRESNPPNGFYSPSCTKHLAPIGPTQGIEPCSSGIAPSMLNLTSSRGWAAMESNHSPKARFYRPLARTAGFCYPYSGPGGDRTHVVDTSSLILPCWLPRSDLLFPCKPSKTFIGFHALPAQGVVERAGGIEPRTRGLKGPDCSKQLSVQRALSRW